MDGHGYHWECLGVKVEDILEEFLPVLLQKGNVLDQKVPADITISEMRGVAVSSLVFPRLDSMPDLQGLALILHDEREEKNLMINAYPHAVKGILHEVEIKTFESDWNSAEGKLLTTFAGEIPITFFDTRYYKNWNSYDAGMRAQFSFAGLAYRVRDITQNEVVIKDPDTIRAMREMEDPGGPVDMSPIPVSLERAAILINQDWKNDTSDNYEFQGVVDELVRIKCHNYELNRVKITLARPGGNDFDVYLYIADRALEPGCELKVGKSITGAMWLQGYLVE